METNGYLHDTEDRHFTYDYMMKAVCETCECWKEEQDYLTWGKDMGMCAYTKGIHTFFTHTCNKYNRYNPKGD